jgi:hypothetical protein
MTVVKRSGSVVRVRVQTQTTAVRSTVLLLLVLPTVIDKMTLPYYLYLEKSQASVLYCS